jgi:DNA invertase Pin-like site-specific DNA recombinase
MDRPGPRQLLADEAGELDVVVVYKVGRLTRTLADFARIVAMFDAIGVTFVSVTRAFNTDNLRRPSSRSPGCRSSSSPRFRSPS